MSESETELRPEVIVHVEALKKELAEIPETEENQALIESYRKLIDSLLKLAAMKPIRRLRRYSTFGREK